MDNFSQVQKTLTSLLIVAFSHSLANDDNGARYPAKTHLQILNNIIKGIPEIVEEPLENDANDSSSDQEQGEMPQCLLDSGDESSKDWIS